MKNNWPIKKLGKVCEVNPKFDNRLKANIEVGFLTMSDVSEDAGIIKVQTRKLSEVKKGFTNFSDGDVLVAKITPCFENGKRAFVERMPNSVGFGSTEFHVLRADKDVLLNKYLCYIVSDKKFRKTHAKFMTGSAGQRRISTDFLKKIKISLPPLKTQKQIVERMDKIVGAQKLNVDLIQKFDELFRSLLHNELSVKFKNQNAKSQFKIKKLKEVAEVIMGQSPPSSTYNERGEGLPFFQGKAEFGEIYPTPVKYCSEPRRIAEAGDILMSVRAPVGNINLAKEKSGIGRGLGAIRARTGVDQSFLHFFFIKNEGNWSRLSVGSTFLAIRRINLDNLEVPLPPLQIQKQIVAKLSAVQEYKKQLLEQKFKLEELFNSVLHKSMNGGMAYTPGVY